MTDSTIGMEYLERDKKLIAEINLPPEVVPRKVVGLSLHGGKPKTIVTEMGYYQSPSMGQRISLALKHTTDKDQPYDADILRQLALLQAIYERFPYLRKEIPMVHGLLADQSGKYLGILTEDFSMGGNAKVEELAEGDGYIRDNTLIPRELADVINNPDIPDYELARTAFLVNGKRRLGDFNTLLVSSRSERIEEILLAVFKEIELYTVRRNAA